LAGMMEKLETIKKFFMEVRAELNKVSWSDKKQVVNGTVAVMIMSAVIALILMALDWGISGLFRYFFT